jgi:methionyl-tRNA formyltransferase
MRLLFMGTPDFAVPSLNALVNAGHEIVCVVAQPDRPKGRGRKLVSPPTIQRARELGLATRQPRAVRRGPFVDWMTQELDADVAVVVAYGRILIPALLDAPRLGCINVHASLLPQYRGAAPIQWAILNGETETGVCTQQMAEGLDTGDILLEARTPIGPDDTGPDLWVRLSQLGADLLVETLARLDTLTPRVQDNSLATHARPLTKEDGVIDWTWTARKVHDRVRGTNPWPSGQTRFRGDTLKLHRTRLISGEVVGDPGEIVTVGKRIVVATGSGGVELVQVQAPGKKRQAAADWANGVRVATGERLG